MFWIICHLDRVGHSFVWPCLVWISRSSLNFGTIFVRHMLLSIISDELFTRLILSMNFSHRPNKDVSLMLLGNWGYMSRYALRESPFTVFLFSVSWIVQGNVSGELEHF